MSDVTSRIIDGFKDNACNEQVWTHLLEYGETDAINLTWRWQCSWWESFGRGRLMLILAERNGEPVALAPFFYEQGMIYNICPEDYLDFVGDISDPAVLDSLLVAGMDQAPDFLGFRLYFIPETSSTGGYLRASAQRLGLVCHDESSLPSPYLDIVADPEVAAAAARKKKPTSS